MSTEKNAQHESCQLSLMWGKMRTIGWETASQKALGNCSAGVEGDMCSQACILAEACC